MNRARLQTWVLGALVLTAGATGQLQRFLHTANAIGGGGRAFG